MRASSTSSGTGANGLEGFDPQPISFQIGAPFAQIGSPVAPSSSSEGTRSTGGAHAASDGPLVTLATQTSLDRWPAFAQQAAAWGGPASVAVYCPCPVSTPCAAAAEELVADLAARYAAAHPRQQVTVSMLYARHYAREGASELPQVRSIVDEQCTGCSESTDARASRQRGGRGLTLYSRRDGHEHERGPSADRPRHRYRIASRCAASAHCL